jgi:hypothetical protein
VGVGRLIAHNGQHIIDRSGAPVHPIAGPARRFEVDTSFVDSLGSRVDCSRELFFSG